MRNDSRLRADLRTLADYRASILAHPPLRQLFLELTERCNEHCVHCGSRCGDTAPVEELTLAEYKRILDDVARDFDLSKLRLAVTGGEPLLRKDFFDILSYAKEKGFAWGMTTNATLIDDDTAKRLYACGMRTVSVSIDGTRETHDRFRGIPGAYDRAMRGVEALTKQPFDNVQITSVITKESIGELDEMFETLRETAIDSWRVIGIEPIGRAKERPDLMLSGEEQKRLLDFIKGKRREGWPVTYGCSHFLGAAYERQVRDWYFLCNAGLYTMSILADGGIVACLDIERRPELLQGNVRTDDLKTVWETRFEAYRNEPADLNERCRACAERDFCHGGARHSWDYDANQPLVCFKDVLF